MAFYKYERWARTNLDVVWDSNPPEVYARCPFTDNHKHGDRTPSFGINLDKGVYVCHGCGEKGHFKELALKLRVALHKDVPTADQAKELVNAARGSEDPEVRVYPESWLKQFLNRKATRYWRQRGLSNETIEEWALGYDSSRNAATIPIRDFHGRVLGVIRRRLAKDAQPRYLYPRGFRISEHLWGAHACHGESKIAIVEGSIDALACWDAHIPAVALLGSHISSHQTNLLRRLGANHVVLMTDRDKAGVAAAEQVRNSLGGTLVSIGEYRTEWVGEDPADLDFSQRRAMFRNAALLGKRKQS